MASSRSRSRRRASFSWRAWAKAACAPESRAVRAHGHHGGPQLPVDFPQPGELPVRLLQTLFLLLLVHFFPVGQAVSGPAYDFL